MASISLADALVGELLHALKNSEYTDNTIVVIFSDHGWQLGEKEHWRKFALWELAVLTRAELYMAIDSANAARPSCTATL